MKGLIVVNAYSKNEEYLYQSKRMQQEFRKLGVETDIIVNNSFLFMISDNSIYPRISRCDFCVYWDKDKYILSMMEKYGIPVFTRYKAIMDCDDKMTTYIELSNKGFPLPKTLPGLLCYRDDEIVADSTIDKVEILGYPLIIKESYGSLGNGVYLINNRFELKETMNIVKCKPHLFQEFIKTSYGRDLRIIVIGGKAIGGMLRTGGDNDFRSNIGAGGSGKSYPLTPALEELAIGIANALDLDYCGIDVLFGKDGPVICEVNSNAFFFSFEKATGINVAKIYAEHIIKSVNA